MEALEAQKKAMETGGHSRTNPEDLDDRITPRLHMLILDIPALLELDAAVDLSCR